MVNKAKLLLKPQAECSTAGKEKVLRCSLNARGQDQALQRQQRERERGEEEEEQNRSP